MDDLLKISKMIQNLNTIYVKDINEKDEVISNLIKEGTAHVDVISKESNYTLSDVYSLTEFIVALKASRSFKDVNEKDELIYRVFKLIKKMV